MDVYGSAMISRFLNALYMTVYASKWQDEKRNIANDTQYYYDVKNEKVLMIFDGMVDGEDNPELIEKILVMHGKQQQKQQEDLDDAAVYRICVDIRMKF